MRKTRDDRFFFLFSLQCSGEQFLAPLPGKLDFNDIKVFSENFRRTGDHHGLTDAASQRKIHQDEILSYIGATAIIRHSYRTAWFMAPLYENGSALAGSRAALSSQSSNKNLLARFSTATKVANGASMQNSNFAFLRCSPFPWIAPLRPLFISVLCHANACDENHTVNEFENSNSPSREREREKLAISVSKFYSSSMVLVCLFHVMGQLLRRTVPGGLRVFATKIIFALRFKIQARSQIENMQRTFKKTEVTLNFCGDEAAFEIFHFEITCETTNPSISLVYLAIFQFYRKDTENHLELNLNYYLWAWIIRRLILPRLPRSVFSKMRRCQFRDFTWKVSSSEKSPISQIEILIFQSVRARNLTVTTPVQFKRRACRTKHTTRALRNFQQTSRVRFVRLQIRRVNVKRETLQTQNLIKVERYVASWRALAAK